MDCPIHNSQPPQQAEFMVGIPERFVTTRDRHQRHSAFLSWVNHGDCEGYTWKSLGESKNSHKIIEDVGGAAKVLLKWIPHALYVKILVVEMN